MGEAFQRQISGWHPHWKRVEAEDAEMKISEWVSRKRKLMWMARFGAEIAKHNALMISRSQNFNFESTLPTASELISVH